MKTQSSGTAFFFAEKPVSPDARRELEPSGKIVSFHLFRASYAGSVFCIQNGKVCKINISEFPADSMVYIFCFTCLCRVFRVQNIEKSTIFYEKK